MSRNGRKAAKQAVSKKTPEKAAPGFTVRLSSTSRRRLHSRGSAITTDYERRICQLELELSQLRSERDVLSFKAAALQSSVNYYAQCFDQAPVGFATLDGVGKVLECNQTFSEMVGAGDLRFNDLFFGRCIAPGYR